MSVAAAVVATARWARSSSGFSGGGYAAYQIGYDWWPDPTPRLYELLYASAPAYNWLPMPGTDMPIPDWGSEESNNRWEWLGRWSAYYRAVAMSEMTAHEFLSADRRQQRVSFANGVVADLNMGESLCRIEGVPAFSGDWEAPAGDLGDYAMQP